MKIKSHFSDGVLQTTSLSVIFEKFFVSLRLNKINYFYAAKTQRLQESENRQFKIKARL